MMETKQIYALRHEPTKRIYIGSSARPGARYRCHLSLLRNGKHPVGDMQADYDAHGEDYSLYILEEVSAKEHRAKEFAWMEKYQSYIRGNGYNYRDRTAKSRHKNPGIPYKEGLPEVQPLNA